MTMRKLLAILATLAILCTVLPLSALFSATAADGAVVFDKNFDDGTNGGFERSVNENGYIVFDATTADWQNTYTYANALKANVDYTVSFKAKANKATNMNFKVNDNWAKDAATVTVDVTTEWQDYEFEINMTSLSTGIVMFSSNAPAASAAIYYIDDVKIVEGKASVTPDEPVAGDDILNATFDTDEFDGVQSTSDISVADGELQFTVTKDWGNIYAELGVEANTDYKVSFRAKAKLGKSAWVKFHKADWSGDICQNDVALSTSWKEYSYTMNSGDNTSLWLLVQYAGYAGEGEVIWFDYITVEKIGGGSTPDTPVVPDVPVDSALINGSFENGSEGWELDSSASITDEDAKDGSYSLRLENPGMWAAAAVQNVAVKPNTDYVIEMWTKRIKLAGALNLFMMDAADNRNLTVVEGQNWFNTQDKDWTKHTIVINTGAATEIVIKWSAEGANAGIMLIDDMTIAEKNAPPAPSAGLVTNGDFETGNATGWEAWQQTVVNADAAYKGEYGVNLIGDGGWGGLLNQNVKVEKGETYVITLWVCPNTGGVNLQIKGATKIDEESDNTWMNSGELSGWTQRTVVAVADSDTMTLNFCGGGNNVAADIYLDEIVVAKKGGSEPVQPSAGLITNGDFETGDATGWEAWQQTVVNADAAYKGQYGVNLIGDGGWGGLLNQNVKVEKGETYVITLWVCPNTGGVNLQVKGATKIDEESDNTWMNSGELNGWTQRTVVAVADSDTMTLNFCGGGNNVAADIYLDEIVVVKKGETPPVDDTYPIKNAGFETGDLTSWENLWNACTYSFETGGYNKSNYALNFAAPGQWQQIRQNKIPVEPNTDYVVVGYVKNPINVNIVVKTGDDSANINEVAIENDMSNKWVRAAVEFNSGDLTDICVLLISREAGASAIWDDVQVYVKGTEPTDVINDEVVTEGPTALNSFGVATNRPATPEANLIINGSFEDAEGGQWQDVLSDTLYVVDDETAPEGNKSLFFNTSGVTENNKVIFYMEVEPDTDYVFSAWVKGAFISADNRFNATIGTTDWKDKFMVYPDAVFSNKDRQIVPPAWDNEWHLRSVGFNSGVNTKIGIGFAGAESQMWIDGIALYTVDNGVKYMDPVQFSGIAPSVSLPEEGYCDQADNLIVNGDMTGSESVDFWSGAMGYQNGFISFPENKYEFGTSMKYAGSEDSCNTHMIKWIDVKPHTDYTFSVDVRVVKDGGRLVLIDGKKRDCQLFMMIDFDQLTYGEEWFTTTVHFDTAEFDRIGIAVVDGGGVALLDNMRFFETANRTEAGDVEYVKPPYAFGSPEDPHYVEGAGSGDDSGSDSPDTGVSVVGAALAMTLVPASAAVAFKLRRKKEDEE